MNPINIQSQKSWKFIYDNRQDWDLTQNVKIEATNHVFRNLIQDNNYEESNTLVKKIINCQHKDGSWGEYKNDYIGYNRSTAFTSQLLYRHYLTNESIDILTSIEKGLLFILKNQTEDGGWSDEKWNIYDATSVPIGTFLFMRQDNRISINYTKQLEKAIQYIIKIKNEDGSWGNKSDANSIEESTSHLLQKLITYGMRDNEINKSIQFLLSRQNKLGYWDNENIDATCDTLRVLIYFCSMFFKSNLINKVTLSINRAMHWLMIISNDGSYGYLPNTKKNVIVTSDFIDTANKYLKFLEKSNVEMKKLYSN